MDWKRAEEYLNLLIGLYEIIGWSGQIGLKLFLLPLKQRFDEGERTQELYDSIMACE